MYKNEEEKAQFLLELLKSVNSQTVAKPNSVELHLTNACNHSCSWCIADEVRKNPWHFKYDDAERLIKQMSEEGVKLLVFSGGGDPMVYKGIERLLTLSKELGITNHMITNGARVTSENVDEIAKSCDRIRLSMDAGSLETHTKIHRPGNVKNDNYNVIIENIKLLSKKMMEYNHYLLTTFIVIEENKHEIQSFIDQMDSIGLKEIEFKTNHFYSKKKKIEIYNYTKEILEKNKQRKIKLSIEYPKSRDLEDKIDSYNYMGWVNGIIEANGDMYPCCHTSLRPDWRMGNVIKDGFGETWYSERRRFILNKMSKDFYCPTCIDYNINHELHKINKQLSLN